MGSNVEINENGVKVPQASEIKEAFQVIFRDAFGTELNLDDATPQGVIIDELTQEKQIDNARLLYLFNQMNPELAEGIFQDAIASLFGIQRKDGTPSVVVCRCYGNAGTEIKDKYSDEPAKVESTNGDVFVCIENGVIGEDGYVDLSFESEENGQIPCAKGMLNSIYQKVTGWDRVDNLSNGSIGSEEESRADFEERRKNSLALNATGSLSAVLSSVWNIPDVQDVLVRENDSDDSVTISGGKFGSRVSLLPHSIYVCVEGGDADRLARAIYGSKSAGCDTTGNLDCYYTDPLTGIEYDFKYSRPTKRPVYFDIVLYSEISDTEKNSIKKALEDNFNGLTSTDSRIGIGDTVFASRFASVIQNLGFKDVQLVDLKLGFNAFGSLSLIDYNIDELPEFVNQDGYIRFRTV